MFGDDVGKQSGMWLPEGQHLSVGFWDAFASGSMWTEPVLLILSCSPIGANHHLILATDGSCAAPSKTENCNVDRLQLQADEGPHLQLFAGREREQHDRHYQHGRLLMRSDAIPCKPDQLVDRLVTLLVYSKCNIKGRVTPVVTDMQLLPGQCRRPNARFITHPLYAANTNFISSIGGTRNLVDDRALEEASTGVVSARKRPREERKGASSERKKATRSLTYNHSRGGPVAKIQRGVRTALNNLHLYSHHWEVLARISYKSDVRCFANAKGESSLFVVHLIDSQATEIRATFFGRAVPLWHPRLRVGGVYTFSMGTLQRANRLRNPLAHEVEMKFDAAAQIEEVPDDPSIPLQRFQRIQLAHVSSLPPGTIVDILAFVVEVKEPQTIISRAKNEEIVRRELSLLDSSGAFVSLALFGAQALQLSQPIIMNRPLVAIKGVRVNEYAGRACLSPTPQMQMSWFPERQPAAGEAKLAVALISQSAEETCGVSDVELEAERRWWRSAGAGLAISATAKSLGRSSFQTLQEIAVGADSLVQAEPGASKSFRTSASVFDVEGKLVWLACPKCKRKVQKEIPSASTSGAYKCNKCRSAVTPEPRWMLRVKFVDISGTLSCVALGEQGEAIMRAVDTTADGISKLEGGGVDTRGRSFADILNQLSFAEFELELTAKCQVYKSEKTVQMMVGGAWLLGVGRWPQVERNFRSAESFLSACRN